ncbi:hypothetical protein VTO73DRAFT_4646 [Trametes versicolor]
MQTVLDELNVPYKFVHIDTSKREHKSLAFSAVQPFGHVPYIYDDGFKLYESRAIACYLALKYGCVGTLIPDPADLQKTVLLEQAASIETKNFDMYASGLAVESIFKKMFGVEPDLALVQRLKTALEGKLDAYDVTLGKTKYLAGDDVTLADLLHFPYGALLET